jgi:hypothetical protein
MLDNSLPNSLRGESDGGILCEALNSVLVVYIRGGTGGSSVFSAAVPPPSVPLLPLIYTTCTASKSEGEAIKIGFVSNKDLTSCEIFVGNEHDHG